MSDLQPSYLLKNKLPPNNIGIRIFYKDNCGTLLSTIVYSIDNADNNWSVFDEDDKYCGVAYGWSYATYEELSEYDLSILEDRQ